MSGDRIANGAAAPSRELRAPRGEGRRGRSRPGPGRGHGVLGLGLRPADRHTIARAPGHRLRPRGDGRLPVLHPRPLEHTGGGRRSARAAAAHRRAVARPRPARSALTAMRLVLFDVDGTILTARGAGRRALAAALKEGYGTAGDLERIDPPGPTEPAIRLDPLA